jgi:uncharacterized protein
MDAMKLLSAGLTLFLLACTDRPPPAMAVTEVYPLTHKARELQISADKGDASAQELLGWMYLKGMGVPIDNSKAAELFGKAAGKGNARAQRLMGHVTLTGTGVNRDPAAAMVWYRKAIAGGDAWANVGLIDARSQAEGNVSAAESLELLGKAERRLLPRADVRSAIGLYVLAKRMAIGPRADGPAMSRALEVLSKAADAGDAEAQRTMGEISLRGDGVVKDAEQSVVWYEKAAAQGDATSQVALAQIYADGAGLVGKNVARAKQMLERAAALNDPDAYFSLGQLYIDGIAVTKQSNVAAQWYQRAAVQGHSAAQNNLAVMYMEGDGVPKDLALAYAWFNIAAAGGHDRSKLNRERLELSGTDRELGQRMSADWKPGKVLKR